MRISGYSGCADCQSHRAPTPTGGGRFSVQANQSTKAELSLTTAEGDKVVISLSTASSAGLSAERSRSGNNTTGDYRSLLRSRNTSGSSAEINIQVEGNLNESELADIRKLAGIVSKASSDVLRGHAEKAADGAAKASELATIQNFAFSLNKQIDYRYSYSAGDNVT